MGNADILSALPRFSRRIRGRDAHGGILALSIDLQRGGNGDSKYSSGSVLCRRRRMMKCIRVAALDMPQKMAGALLPFTKGAEIYRRPVCVGGVAGEIGNAPRADLERPFVWLALGDSAIVAGQSDGSRMRELEPPPQLAQLGFHPDSLPGRIWRSIRMDVDAIMATRARDRLRGCRAAVKELGGDGEKDRALRARQDA